MTMGIQLTSQNLMLRTMTPARLGLAQDELGQIYVATFESEGKLPCSSTIADTLVEYSSKRRRSYPHLRSLPNLFYLCIVFVSFLPRMYR